MWRYVPRKYAPLCDICCFIPTGAARHHSRCLKYVVESCRDYLEGLTLSNAQMKTKKVRPGKKERAVVAGLAKRSKKMQSSSKKTKLLLKYKKR
ncbi:hypothetical protein TELCIR_07026 [Teladorsagia circumcincta]|uniref:Uncharacterized protein n=1 Tax=Teladorsagia circumcincta TaxID=45464 RepID=A0A2G9UMY0_TELCI|nr:hypothetical protein TELCIR_07026 [Teladorsagia circumcincta]